jgi:hypothetical protein
VGYKYLGLRVVEDLQDWGEHHAYVCRVGQRVVAAYAQRAIALGYPARICMMIYKVMVRATWEYGSEVIWYTQKQADELESLQLRFGRTLLGVSATTAGTFVRGELDLEPLEMRRDRQKLRFWQKIENQPETRLLRQVFEQSLHMERVVDAEGFSLLWPSQMTKLLEKKYGGKLNREWHDRHRRNRDEWKEETDRIMRKEFEKRWHKKVARNKDLVHYAAIRSTPGYNTDLDCLPRRRFGLLNKLKYLSSCILFEHGRLERCICGSSLPTVKHVIAECPATAALRLELARRLSRSFLLSLPDSEQFFASVFASPDKTVSLVLEGRDFQFHPDDTHQHEQIEKHTRNFLVCLSKRLHCLS